METSSVFIEWQCQCKKRSLYKIRLYPTRISIDTLFDKLPKYDGIADLEVIGSTAHITAFVMSGYSKFRRMHDYDLEKMIRLKLPEVTTVCWERHKDGETVKLMREL